MEEKLDRQKWREALHTRIAESRNITKDDYQLLALLDILDELKKLNGKK